MSRLDFGPGGRDVQSGDAASPLTAAALGSLIGFEGERLLWAAGIRTHMLVCVGSCLIMIVSQYGFSSILTEKNVVLDPSRIAAQVVSGIGFLGAGAILARGEIVKGLTTAASIWTVAAVGQSCQLKVEVDHGGLGGVHRDDKTKALPGKMC